MKIIDWIVAVARAIVKGREIGLYNENDRSVTRKEPEKFNQPAKPGARRGRR